jgi:hypothetical protein
VAVVGGMDGDFSGWEVWRGVVGEVRGWEVPPFVWGKNSRSRLFMRLYRARAKERRAIPRVSLRRRRVRKVRRRRMTVKIGSDIVGGGGAMCERKVVIWFIDVGKTDVMVSRKGRDEDDGEGGGGE